MKSFRLYLLVLAMLIGVSTPRGAAQAFTVTDLGTGYGYSINNSGHILLVASDSQGNRQFFVVYSNGFAQPLLENPIEFGNINDKDQVAGGGFINGFYHAGLYTTSSVTDLQATAQFLIDYSAAYGVNRLGHATGYFYGPTSFDVSINNLQYFLYDGSTMQNLGPGFTGNEDVLPCVDDAAWGTAINNNDQITGYSNFDNNGVCVLHAFLSNSTGTTFTDLGTITGCASYVPTAINDAAQIVGNADCGHAFWYVNGTMHDLTTLPRQAIPMTSAYGINRAGLIVGTGMNSSNQQTALLFMRGKTYDLNTLIPANSGFTRLLVAYGINNSGQITGAGITTGGSGDAFLLTPIRK